MSNSDQEQFVHSLSQHVFGAYGLFFPSLYGNGKEPADLAWVLNRSAILFYMTAGKQSFEKKVRHNIYQMGRWLKVWSQGATLAGQSGKADHSYSIDDVDNVIVISVVDSSGDGFIRTHLEQIEYHSIRKLRICLTITENLLKFMSSGLCFPLDFVRIFTWMTENGYRELQERTVIEMWSKKIHSELSNVESGIISQIGGLPIIRQNSADVSNLISVALKKELSEKVSTELFYDLRQADYLSLLLAFAYMDSMLAGHGEYGKHLIKSKWRSGQYEILCVSTISLTYMLSKGPPPLSAAPGFTIIRSHDAGIEHPMHILAFQPRSGRSEMETALGALRSKKAEM